MRNVEEYKVFLYVIYEILIEIRASESLENCRAMADIIHNIPSQIAIGMNTSAIREKILSNAQRLGYDGDRFVELINRNQEKAADNKI